MTRTRSLFGIILAFVLVIGFLQWYKFRTFQYNGLDLGIYTQTVWSLAHGQGFANSIHPTSYLGDHFEPVLFALSLLYRIWPSPLGLLWAQTLALASSIALVWMLTKQMAPRVRPWIAAALWAPHPFLYNPAMYEFHGLTFALPLILGGILAHERRRWGLWVILMIGLMLLREDLPIVTFAWAILAAIDRAPRRWWASTAILSIVVFLSIHAFISANNAESGYKYLAFLGWMGTNWTEILSSPIFHPIVFLRHVFQPDNWQTTFGLLAGFGFLPLFRPRLLIPIALYFVQLLLIGASPSSVLLGHYTVVYTPFLIWSTIAFLRDRPQAVVLASTRQSFAYTPILYAIALVSPIYLQLFWGPLSLPWQRSQDADITSPEAVRQSLTHIQPADRVISTFNVLPAVAGRQTVYSLNYVYLGRQQYSQEPYVPNQPIDTAIIDWKEFYDLQFLFRRSRFQDQTGEARVIDLLEKNQLHPVSWVGSVVVYRRTGLEMAPMTRSTNKDIAPGARIGSVKFIENNQAEIELLWKLPEPIQYPLSVRLTLVDSTGRAVSTTRLVGEGANPAVHWPVGSKWSTLYRVNLPNDFSPARVDVAWGSVVGPYQLNRLRSFQYLGHTFIERGHDRREI